MKLALRDKLFFLLCLLLTFWINTGNSSAQKTQLTARLLHEYGYTNWELESANLDYAVQEFQKESDSKLFIIIYGKPEYVWWKSRTLKYYLENVRACCNECVTVIEGGEEKESTQIWLVPKDAGEPVPSSLASYPSNRNKIHKVWQDCYACEYKPPDGWVYQAFAEELMQNPTTKGYLVFYQDNSSTVPYKAATQYLKDAKSKLLNEYKIDVSRIKVLYAGAGFGRIEFWVVPKGSSLILPQNRKSVKKK